MGVYHLGIKVVQLILANIFNGTKFTGITVHETTKDLDAGAIIHQEIVDLNIEDGIHENACRVTEFFSEFS